MKVMKSISAGVAIALVAGMTLAVPAAQAQPDDRSRRQGVVAITGSRTFLGVGVVEVNADRVKALNLKEERGVEITRVEENSPAAKAGLKTQDVVLEYAGSRVEGAEQFVRLVRETPPGREVKLQINRGGQIQTVAATVETRKMKTIELGDMHIAVPNMSLPEIRIPEMIRGMELRSSMLGVEAESLNPQLAEFFGVKEGVLIRSVSKGSAAEKAGIKAGDVVTKVEDRKVNTPSEVTRALRTSEKKPVAVSITREKREMTVNVTIEDAADGRPRGRSVRSQEF
jgi:serine protease Do